MKWAKHQWYTCSGDTRETLKCIAGGIIALAVFLGLGWAGLI